MKYSHTQIGYVMIGSFIFVALLFASIFTQEGIPNDIIILMAFVLVLIASFVTLKVTIDDTYLRIKFGYGIFRKKFLLKNIVSVAKVTNSWYHGWGIRLWLWPYRWLFNVSGFNAVEIVMKNKRIYRIGTDQPEILEKEIKKAIKK